MKTFVIATRNKHKVEEIRSILGEEDCRFLTLSDFPDAPPIVEDGNTFVENAMKKSVGIAQWIASSDRLKENGGRAYVLADDSGLEVDGLNGAPGVHSARFAAMDTGAAGNSPDHENNAKLIRLLEGVPANRRTARFRCVISVTPVLGGANAETLGQKTKTFAGACEGRIVSEPSGKDGFGYDPLFIPQGYSDSFAELGEEVKNRLSHRAKALQQLRESLPRL
ncbi:MAG: non-canonical purine NTP pyrophosphatase [Limisphaerales bacterium]